MNVILFAIAALWGIGYLAKKAPVSQVEQNNGQGSIPVSSLPVGGIPFEGDYKHPIAVVDDEGNVIGYLSQGAGDKTSFIVKNPAVDSTGITPVLGGAIGGGFSGVGEGSFSPTGGSASDPNLPILV
jgi:hypothetical protein